MDIEQLKMILDAASVAGAGSKEMFYIFIGASVLETLLTTFGILFIVLCAVKILNKLITDYSDADKLRRAAGVSYRWSESELELACVILKQHFQKEVTKLGGI